MSQFGGSSREDDFGYFGSAKPSGSGSESQFGSAPAAGSQFGAPPAQTYGAPPAGPAPFGTPAPPAFGYPPPPTASSSLAPARRPKTKKILVVALTLIAIGASYFLWGVYQMTRPVTIPTTLAGYPQTTAPGLIAATNVAEEGIRNDNPGINLEAQAYGGADGFALLFVTRGRVKVDQELKDLGVGTGPVTIGESTCALSAVDEIAFCVRTSRTKSVEVLMSKGSTVEQAAAAVDAAWAAQ